MYYVYMLMSLDTKEEFYLGYTKDLKKRVERHNNGKNKSTKGRKWELVYYEAYLTSGYAKKREDKLKRNRRMKQLLLKRIKASIK